MKYLIETKYQGPSDDGKGARITATCAAAKKTIPYPHELSYGTKHLAAAQALCRHLGWNHLTLEEVTLPDGEAGFVAQSK